MHKAVMAKIGEKNKGKHLKFQGIKSVRSKALSKKIDDDNKGITLKRGVDRATGIYNTRKLLG